MRQLILAIAFLALCYFAYEHLASPSDPLPAAAIPPPNAKVIPHAHGVLEREDGKTESEAKRSSALKRLPSTISSVSRKLPNDFAIKSNVLKLFREWQRRQASPIKGIAHCMPSEALSAIRVKLFQYHIYEEAAIEQVIRFHLREPRPLGCGVPETQINEVAGGILAMQ